MRFQSWLVVSVLLQAAVAGATAPQVQFKLPSKDSTPSVFGQLPYPCDLYFDGGAPGDGDGTLLNSGASIGLDVDVIRTNTKSVEDALDLMDGFGTTTAVYFFFDSPIDTASLPASPVLAPALTDSVFCADTATLTPVPVLIGWDVDSRIRNTLAILPAPGKPLKPSTTYTCVVKTGVTGGGAPITPSADWSSVRDGASANSDADAIFDPVVTALGGQGIAAGTIAGMTVFTTQSTTTDLLKIRDVVLPALPVPAADLTSQPGLVAKTPAQLTALVGTPGAHVGMIATGFYPSPRFQTHDPDGDGPLQDLPNPPGFITCSVPCETNDERFTRDLSGIPVVIDVPKIPFTVVVPAGTPPANGWPVVIQQHGLGGQRDTVVDFGEPDAAKGFASIGIDAAAHGYRFFDCKPDAPCSQDTANNFGGTTVPDGFVDGSFAGFDVGFLTVNLGFFQAFHNFLGIRDNFRQTYADLLSLVRLVKGGTIDDALGTKLDGANIYYMGHSLGGIMGSGFIPIEPDVKASLLNATGGGLTSQLFLNSSIGAGATTLVNGILGLDPNNVQGQFALMPNFTQSIMDPADGLNSASLLLAPDLGAVRNFIQVEDFGDQVVPNQSNEALAVATGLELYDPFVVNLHMSPFTLPVVSTLKSVHANAGNGTATAALLQNGPATHAQSIVTLPGIVDSVPEFAHVEEFPQTGDAFPPLLRGIRVPNAGILDAVLDWFVDVVAHGTPGTFAFTGDENWNPIQNIHVPMGASTQTFFARPVDEGGGATAVEPTPDVVLAYTSNAVDTRVTVGRSILGSTAEATDADVPPGPPTVGTPGVLPFFVTIQRELPGAFSANVTIAYSSTELALAAIPAGSADEKALTVGLFTPGTCTLGGTGCTEDGDCGADGPCVGARYAALPTTIDATAHTATALVLVPEATLAVLHPAAISGGYAPPLVTGGGSPRTDCLAGFAVANPGNTPFTDAKGRVNGVQTCHDGDPTCDADGTADGTCTFRVAICFNHRDATVPKCQPDAVRSYRLVTPSTKSKDAVERANAQALLGALLDLGGTAGKKGTTTFDPAILAPTCTRLAEVKVAVGTGKKSGARIRGAARAHAGDADAVQLECAAPTG
jgi:hypothetical protein